MVSKTGRHKLCINTCLNGWLAEQAGAHRQSVGDHRAGPSLWQHYRGCGGSRPAALHGTTSSLPISAIPVALCGCAHANQRNSYGSNADCFTRYVQGIGCLCLCLCVGAPFGTRELIGRHKDKRNHDHRGQHCHFTKGFLFKSCIATRFV